MFVSADQVGMGFDPGFAVHRVGIRPRVRCQRGGVDGHGLIFKLQIQIDLQVPRIDRRIWHVKAACVAFFLQIPPPFLGWVQATFAYLVIKLCQHRCGGG